MWELIKRTSVEARIETMNVRADDASLFEYPFVYMSGDQEFPPLSEKEIGNLKLYLGVLAGSCFLNILETVSEHR